MKHLQLFLFLFIFCLSGELLAQDSLYVDSLKNSLLISNDTNRLESLIELARELEDARRRDTSARSEGLQYARQARTLSRQLKDSLAEKETRQILKDYYRKSDMRDSLRMIRQIESLLSYQEGYHIPSPQSFREREEPIGLRSRVLIYYDSTGLMSLEEVMTLDDFGPNAPPENDMETYKGGAWWSKVRMVSDEPLWSEHVFFTGGKDARWDTVMVFSQSEDSSWVQQITGEALPEKEWRVPGESNYFRLRIPPQKTQEYYIRVRGTENGMVPSRIDLFHVNYEALLREKVKDRHVHGIFQGVVLIQLFFFLLLFIATRDHIYGYYVLYILGLGLFILTVNYAGDISGFNERYRILLYITALTFCVMGMLTFSYNYLNMDTYMRAWRKYLKAYLILFVILAVLVAGAMVYLINSAQGGQPSVPASLIVGFAGLFFGILIVAGFVFLPIWGIRVYRKKYSPAKYYLIATVFLLLGVVIPIVLSFFSNILEEWGYALGDVNSTILEAGIALQLCLFALAVGHKRNLLEKERREALERNLEIQQKINVATDRFVPYEFLRTLGRESILDVSLGDQVEKKVTVFFSDIRDYTSLSEQMTPQQNFIFLNQYLGRIGPVIKTNRGFVNQYYGDGLLALFMTEGQEVLSQQDAVIAAIEMHAQLKEYNEERILKEREPIRIGIGIHNGPLMLGVIGDEKRMNVGVVSDTVNTAARLEGLTKFYGATTIVSGQTFDGLNDPSAFHYRPLGEVMVKGRKTPIAIYDFFDGDPGHTFDQKASSRRFFIEGYAAYFERRFSDAVEAFEEVLRIFPHDRASLFFLERAMIYAKQGVPDGWTGMEILDRK